MNWDVIAGFGAIGIMFMIIFICIFIIIAPIIIAVFIANALSLTGVVWWAFVIVCYMIIAGVITKLSS